ncbi:MAG: endo-1,4-beta-xylanase [Phycisphaerales bacterium JB039]
MSLSFAIFDEEGRPATSWPLGHAFLSGPDGSPSPSELQVADGRIVCGRPSGEAAALTVQFPVGSGGDLLSLSTTLLPVRAEPYLLSLEIARERIMLGLNAMERWGLFGLPAEDPAMDAFTRARDAFFTALVRQRAGGLPSAEADRLARESIDLCVQAGEQLALREAAQQWAGRISGERYREATRRAERALGIELPSATVAIKAPDSLGVTLPGTARLGCAVNPAIMTEPMQKAIAATCDFITVPMRWAHLEPREGEYSFRNTDRWIEWAVRKAKLPICAGPLIDFADGATPEWLSIWENDYETLRDLIYEHVKQIVTRYRRTVTWWTVVSGLPLSRGFRLRYEQIMDLTRVCVLATRKLHPKGKVQVEVAQPFGEYAAARDGVMGPLLYADVVSQSGIQLDAIALRIEMGQPAPGGAARDLMMLSELLDRYAELDKPLSVSVLGAPSEAAPADGADPGRWRGGWTAETQAQWLEGAAAIAMAKPYIHSVSWQELADSPRPMSMPGGGLMTPDGLFKPALKKFAELRQAARQGSTPAGLAGAAK